jgi:AcrR family transcriptional regulator
MKRASTAEKKEERRASIIAQARDYISSRSFDEVRLGDLASELGIVKGTLYLYFPTKQDLFATILVDEMEAWWAQATQNPPSDSPGKDLGPPLAARTLLVRLVASLHMTIEPGLSPDGLLRMKGWFRDFALRAALDLEARYEDITGQGPGLVLRIYALVLGAAQLAMPPVSVKAMVDSNDSFALFRISLGDLLIDSIDSLYRGACRPRPKSFDPGED